MYNEMGESKYLPGEIHGLANANSPRKDLPLLINSTDNLNRVIMTNDKIISELLDTVNRFRAEPHPMNQNNKEIASPINGFIGELDNYVELLALQTEKMQYILTRLKNIIG